MATRSKSEMVRMFWLLIGLVLVSVGGQAGHPFDADIWKGVVLARDGPVLADMFFYTCEGSQVVSVTVSTSQGVVRDEFLADFRIIEPETDCLLENNRGPIVALVQLKNDTIGVRLDGVSQNGLHYAGSEEFYGTYRFQPSVFARVWA